MCSFDCCSSDRPFSYPCFGTHICFAARNLQQRDNLRKRRQRPHCIIGQDTVRLVVGLVGHRRPKQPPGRRGHR